MPAKSPYALLIKDLLAWHKQSPQDWEKVWQQVETKWDRRDPCPDGALRDFNIDAKLNGAYIAFGLLFGDGDMTKTIEISTRAGQDSDCNPSSAAGILGTILGYEKIPGMWKDGIPKISDRKFRYTEFTFKTIVDSTYNRALAVAKKNGGSVAGDVLTVKMQAPKEPKLELWDDYGSPVERIAYTDPRWKFTGAWQDDAKMKSRWAEAKGAETTVEFEGTGAILAGPYLPEGGQADVYLDGKFSRTVDVYPDEDNWKGGESVWHQYHLRPGKHTLRVVVKGEKYGASRGAHVAVTDLVLFR